MANPVILSYDSHHDNVSAAMTERPVAKIVLMALAFGFLALFLVLPLVPVFAEALRNGFGAFGEALADPDTLSAIRLTVAGRRDRGAART